MSISLLEFTRRFFFLFFLLILFASVCVCVCVCLCCFVCAERLVTDAGISRRSTLITFTSRLSSKSWTRRRSQGVEPQFFQSQGEKQRPSFYQVHIASVCVSLLTVGWWDGSGRVPSGNALHYQYYSENALIMAKKTVSNQCLMIISGWQGPEGLDY